MWGDIGAKREARDEGGTEERSSKNGLCQWLKWHATVTKECQLQARVWGKSQILKPVRKEARKILREITPFRERTELKLRKKKPPA